MRWVAALLAATGLIQQLQPIGLGLLLLPIQLHGARPFTRVVMALYSPEIGLAAGIGAILNQALLTAIDPQQPIIHRLLDGYPKVLSVEWCGPFTEEALKREADPGRGDGQLKLHTHPSDPLYALPPGVEVESLNIRMGVPLWVFGWLDGQRTPLAAGLLHPLFVSATLDFWSPATGLHERRLYIHDPRLTAEDLVQEPQQLRRMAEMAKLEAIGAGLPQRRPQLRPSLAWH